MAERMELEKKLGKIKKVKFGFDDNYFGLHLTLGNDEWGTMCGHRYNTACKNDSTREMDMMVMIELVQKLLKDAKVDSVDQLLNKPIECTFDRTILKDFRILTEVL